MDVRISQCWLHTDSMTTFFRLQSKDKKQPVFVSNRVNKILLSTKAKEWRWVPTDLNPADVVSRGASPDEESKWHLFYNGPEYITKDIEEWPRLPASDSTVGALEVGNRPQEVGNRPQEVNDRPQEVNDCLQEVDDRPQVGGRASGVGGRASEVGGRASEVSGRSKEGDVGPTIIMSKS